MSHRNWRASSGVGIWFLKNQTEEFNVHFHLIIQLYKHFQSLHIFLPTRSLFLFRFLFHVGWGSCSRRYEFLWHHLVALFLHVTRVSHTSYYLTTANNHVRLSDIIQSFPCEDDLSQCVQHVPTEWTVLTADTLSGQSWTHCVKRAESIIPACSDSGHAHSSLDAASGAMHLQFTFQKNYRNPLQECLLIQVAQPFRTLFFPPLQYKSILSDQLKGIWPLRLLADHQKIVFTTTLSTTLTLTNTTVSTAVWAPKCTRAEAGLGLVDHIISTPLCMLYLEAILLATPESVPHKVVLTDGENGETDQKVNKYLQKRLQP